VALVKPNINAPTDNSITLKQPVLVECPSCQTKFTVSQAAISSNANPAFHCSRCDSVFSCVASELKEISAKPISPYSGSQPTNTQYPNSPARAGQALRSVSSFPAVAEPTSLRSIAANSAFSIQENNVPDANQSVLTEASGQIPLVFNRAAAVTEQEATEERELKKPSSLPLTGKGQTGKLQTGKLTKDFVEQTFQLAGIGEVRSSSLSDAKPHFDQSSNSQSSNSLSSNSLSSNAGVDSALRKTNNEAWRHTADGSANSAGFANAVRSTLQKFKLNNLSKIFSAKESSASFSSSRPAASNLEYTAALTRPVAYKLPATALVVPMAACLIVLASTTWVSIAFPSVGTFLASTFVGRTESALGQGLILRGINYSKLTLENGLEMGIISGAVYNGSGASISRATVEGAVFGRNGVELSRVKTVLGNKLNRAKIQSLTADMIADLQSERRARNITVRPGESHPFVMALPLTDGAAREASQGNYNLENERASLGRLPTSNAARSFSARILNAK